MKRIAFLLLMMSMVIDMQAGEKTCPVCAGLGHAYGRSDITCSRCNGRGLVPLSAAEEQREARDRERYSDNANDMMEQFNLSPEEFFAYEELIKQSMTKVPIYQNCTSCGGTGNCRQCGGYMNVSLDGDLCMICQGSGICIACKGAGKIKIGEQDNPQKEQLIQRAKEILNHGEQRRANGENAYGTRNSAGQVHSDNYDNGGGYNSRNEVINDNEDDEDDGDDDDDDSSGSSHSDSPLLYVLYGVLGAGVLGGLGYLLFRKK